MAAAAGRCDDHQWRLRQRQPSPEHGIPLVTAGLTEDKADVNAALSPGPGVGINLATNQPTPEGPARRRTDRAR
ncbi:MAG: hypothetical protein WDN69_02650 [Aliidongia sp.]